MPTEKQWQDAVNWALQQIIIGDFGVEIQVSKNTPCFLVDKVREYFDDNAIQCNPFSYAEVESYLPN